MKRINHCIGWYIDQQHDKLYVTTSQKTDTSIVVLVCCNDNRKQCISQEVDPVAMFCVPQVSAVIVLKLLTIQPA